MNTKNIYSKFNLKFDEIKDFKEEQLKLLFKDSVFKDSKYFDSLVPKFVDFDEYIYDLDFAKKSLKTAIYSEFSLFFKNITYLIPKNHVEDFEKIKKYCKDEVKVGLTLDKTGIHTIRFEFILYENKQINTPDLIKIAENTCCICDEDLFQELEKDLINLLRKIGEKQNSSKIFSLEHATYTITTSTNTNLFAKNNKSEIAGIAMRNENFEDLSQEIVSKILSNNVSLYKDECLIVTSMGIFIVLDNIDLDDDYITDRIFAIEMFYRQNLILKKDNLLLEGLIKDITPMLKKIQESLIEIQDIQIEVQTELSIYENIMVSVTDSYNMLFGKLNHVLQMDIYYDIIKSKIETSKSIYESLNDNRRNELMKNIQYILIFLGALTIIVPLFQTEIHSFFNIILSLDCSQILRVINFIVNFPNIIL